MIHLLPRIAALALPLCLLYGASAAVASDAPAAPVAGIAQTPHVALLLPTRSKLYGRHAEALRDGFLAARDRDRQLLPVREYAVSEEVGNVLEGYRTAVAGGAQVVVGPLTRDAVTALALGEPVPVPTLALNVPDHTGRSPPNLYALSLQMETEALQAAQLAWNDGQRSAIIVAGSGPVQIRMRSAFSSEFVRLGGKILAEQPFSTDPEKLRSLANENTDMYFLALTHTEARTARSYLGATPIYATSSVHAGDLGPLAGFDLAGITFVEMPWLLEPNHAAVMIYPRGAARSIDLERLYALGIDAWRIAQLLLTGARDIRLDGVTGQLSLGPDGRILRKLSPGRYVDGRPQPAIARPARREPPR